MAVIHRLQLFADTAICFATRFLKLGYLFFGRFERIANRFYECFDGFFPVTEFAFSTFVLNIEVLFRKFKERVAVGLERLISQFRKGLGEAGVCRLMRDIALAAQGILTPDLKLQALLRAARN